MAGCFYICTWFRPVHELGKRRLCSQVHKVRGGLASVHVSAFLAGLGYGFSSTLINVPSRIQSPTPEGTFTTDASRSIVWIPMRVPLDDKAPQRRVIDRSESLFQKKVLESFRPYFEVCCRKRITLKKGVALIHPADAFRACVFQEFNGGVLTHHGTGNSRLYKATAGRMTVGYVLALAPQDGIGRLIAAFGSGGTETLLLSHLLTTEFRECTASIVNGDEPRLLMVQFSLPEHVPAPLLSNSTAELNPSILTDQPLRLF